MNDRQIAEKICEILRKNGIEAAWTLIDMEDANVGHIELTFEITEGGGKSERVAHGIDKRTPFTKKSRQNHPAYNDSSKS